MTTRAAVSRLPALLDRVDVFDRMPVGLRLWAAVLLSAAGHQLLVTFVQNPGIVTPGLDLPATCDADGFCTVGSYVPGIYLPGGINPVTSAIEAQAFLALAVALLVVAALQPRTPGIQQVVRIATGALAIALVLSATQGRVTAILGVAVLLVGPPAWRPVRPR